MILVSIIFFGGIGYLEGAQEAPDLPLAVAPPGSGCARWGGPESGQNHHHINFYTKWHMYYSVLCWYLALGVILNHSTVYLLSITEMWAINETFLENSINAKLNAETNGFIATFKQVSWKIWCKMRFTPFPVDKQVTCKNSQKFKCASG